MKKDIPKKKAFYYLKKFHPFLKKKGENLIFLKLNFKNTLHEISLKKEVFSKIQFKELLLN